MKLQIVFMQVRMKMGCDLITTTTREWSFNPITLVPVDLQQVLTLDSIPIFNMEIHTKDISTDCCLQPVLILS